MKLTLAVVAALMLLICGSARAVDLKNCDTITSIPDRAKCLQQNEVVLKSAIENLQQYGLRRS
jgi:hypothetical protein